MMGPRLVILGVATTTIALAVTASAQLPARTTTITGDTGSSAPAGSAGSAGGPAGPARPPADSPAAAPGVAPDPPSAPWSPLTARPVTVPVDGFLSWALLDRRTGAIAGSANRTATSSTESMVKIWLVSDYLRRAAERGEQPGGRRLDEARRAIRDSDNNAAQSLYQAGGGNAVIERMISRCRLTDTSRHDSWWSRTRISARDAVRLGDCVAGGTAAGPRWTPWVITQMTQVRGTTAAADQPAGGRWGIVDGLPAHLRTGLAMMNGWTLRSTDQWHVNCLGVTEDWALAVLTRYPDDRGLAYGARLCASVTRQLVTDGG